MVLHGTPTIEHSLPSSGIRAFQQPGNLKAPLPSMPVVPSNPESALMCDSPSPLFLSEIDNQLPLPRENPSTLQAQIQPSGVGKGHGRGSKRAQLTLEELTGKYILLVFPNSLQ